MDTKEKLKSESVKEMRDPKAPKEDKSTAVKGMIKKKRKPLL